MVEPPLAGGSAVRRGLAADCTAECEQPHLGVLITCPLGDTHISHIHPHSLETWSIRYPHICEAKWINSRPLRAGSVRQGARRSVQSHIGDVG